jgi:hypothetical protein
MESTKDRTIRFDTLVQKSGSPETATLWLEPEKDREFMRAVKNNRVLTVHQENVGTKKDFGVIGFFKEKNAAFLVFPKKLSMAAGTKVNGIKYEKISTKPPRNPIAKESIRPVSRKFKKSFQPSKLRAEKPQPAAKKEKPVYRFVSSVHIVAEQTIPVEVEAQTAKEAKALIEHKAQELKVDVNAATSSRNVGAIKMKK